MNGRRLARFTPASRLFPASLAGSQTGYTRFIVLTSARSGSSLLIQSLRSHPGVVAFGEILGPGNVWFNVAGFPSRHRGLKRFRNREPLRFLDACVFRGYPAGTEAVGFKVFCSHLEEPRFGPVADHLRGMRGLRVVHLVRGNLLRAYLSEVIRSKTGVGWIHAEGERTSVSVELDPDDCEAYFTRERELHDRYGRLFATRDVLDIGYEELVADYASVTASLQRFLGVEPQALSSPTIRQQVRPLPEVIANYADLESHFAGSPWEGFFD